MPIVRAMYRFIIGFAFGLGIYLMLLPALAAFAVLDRPAGPQTALTAVGVVTLSGGICLLASSLRRALSWGFLLLGLVTLALPLSTLLLSSRAATALVENALGQDLTHSAFGAGIAAAALGGFATLVGLVLGTIFVIIGIALAFGRRREVIFYPLSG